MDNLSCVTMEIKFECVINILWNKPGQAVVDDECGRVRNEGGILGLIVIWPVGPEGGEELIEGVGPPVVSSRASQSGARKQRGRQRARPFQPVLFFHVGP